MRLRQDAGPHLGTSWSIPLSASRGRGSPGSGPNSDKGVFQNSLPKTALKARITTRIGVVRAKFVEEDDVEGPGLSWDPHPRRNYVFCFFARLWRPTRRRRLQKSRKRRCKRHLRSPKSQHDGGHRCKSGLVRRDNFQATSTQEREFRGWAMAESGESFYDGAAQVEAMHSLCKEHGGQVPCAREEARRCCRESRTVL